MLSAALAGFLAGFVGSIPVAGPIAVLVLWRSLQGRLREAILIGCGAAIPEAAYAFLAYWGFASFLADAPLVVPISRAVGALILFGLAYSLARSQPPSDPELAAVPVVRGGAGSFFLGFSIAALNPTLIVTWAAVLSMVASMDLLDMAPELALPFSAAAAVGMASWCVLMTVVVGRFRSRLSREVIVKVYRAMAVLVFGLAVVFVVGFVECL